MKELAVVLVTFGSQKQLVDIRIVYYYGVTVDMTLDNYSYRAGFRMAVAPLGNGINLVEIAINLTRQY